MRPVHFQRQVAVEKRRASRGRAKAVFCLETEQLTATALTLGTAREIKAQR